MPSAVREMMEVTDEGIAMADSDVNLNMNNCDDGCATFDVQRFLRGLDAIFDAHKAPEQAEPYLQKARTEAEHSHNDAGLLTVLNETMGFYRSQGRHTDNRRLSANRKHCGSFASSGNRPAGVGLDADQRGHGHASRRPVRGGRTAVPSGA